MMFQLSNTAARVLLLASYLFSLFLSYSSIRLGPSSARGRYFPGRFRRCDFDQVNPDAPLRALLTARALDPVSADLPFALSPNCEEPGNAAELRSPFVRTERGYPLSAELAWTNGSVLRTTTLAVSLVPAAGVSAQQ